MRVVSFLNTSMQPLLIAPPQILAPLIAKLKDAFGGKGVAANDQHVHRPKLSTDAETKKSQAMIDTIASQKSMSRRQTARRGLRIVREIDSEVGSDCAGRMVISGRMADVCAELDRMVLRSGQNR